MRIEKFHIEGFGHFADRSFGPFASPIVVLYGPNEAGKSTLLSFLQTILFGFPTRGGAQHYPPLAGGRHGGRIDVLDQFEDRYSVHRIQGRGGGPVTVLSGSGDTQNEAALARLLGHHAEDVFKSVFSFSLDELHSDRLLKDENINSQIYSAGMGVVKLPDALKEIKDRKDRRFLKGGSRHSIYQTVEELKDVKSKLNEVESNAERYGRLTERRNEVHEKRSQLDSISSQLKTRLDYQRRLKNGWDDWVDLNTAEESLKDFEVITDFPADGLRRLEQLEERIRGARQAYEETRAQVELEESKAKTGIEHESILEHADSVRYLERNREHFESAVRDLPSRELERKHCEQRLQATLREIGPGWSTTRLEGFDLSVAVRDEVSQFGDRLRKSEEKLERLRVTHSQEEARLQEATKAENAAQQELDKAPEPILSKEQISEHRATIGRANTGLLELKAVRERSLLLQDQLDGMAGATESGGRGTRQKALVGLVSVLGLGLLIGGVFLGGAALVVGAIGGLALIAIAAYLLVQQVAASANGVPRQASPIRDALARAEAEREELESKLSEYRDMLGLESVDSDSLIAYAASLDEYEGRIQEFAALCKSLDLARETTKERSESVEQSNESIAAAEAQQRHIRNEWQQWLRAHELNEALSPQVVEEIRGKVEQGLDRLREKRDLQQRILAMKESTAEFFEAVTPLAYEFEIGLNKDEPTSATVAADKLNSLHNDVEKNARQRQVAVEALAEAGQRLEERKRDLQKAELELKELLRSGGASNSEEFRKREEVDSQRKAYEAKLRDALNRLQRICGPGKPLEEFKSALGKTDIQSIDDQARQFLEELDAIDAQLAELDTELGSIKTELGALAGEEESSRLRMARSLLLEQIREHAREWAKHALAERLLGEAQSTFERERQPGVVRNAEGFFENITGGRYERVTAPLGGNTIRVSQSNGLSKEPEALSRGTREQLFLSLRFGLVQELSRIAEPLPVIVDEVLVNFDPDRALRAAKAFVQLASTNQVLVFTCHTTVVDYFQVAAKELESNEPTLIEV